MYLSFNQDVSWDYIYTFISKKHNRKEKKNIVYLMYTFNIYIFFITLVHMVQQ